ncbi:hypothetical protein ID866_939 [Astraeus odoratus]|nr:hypothetical protein ID866_939 [Astraeus odoratus]
MITRDKIINGGNEEPGEAAGHRGVVAGEATEVAELAWTLIELLTLGDRVHTAQIGRKRAEEIPRLTSSQDLGVCAMM